MHIVVVGASGGNNLSVFATRALIPCRKQSNYISVCESVARCSGAEITLRWTGGVGRRDGWDTGGGHLSLLAVTIQRLHITSSLTAIDIACMQSLQRKLSNNELIVQRFSRSYCYVQAVHCGAQSRCGGWKLYHRVPARHFLFTSSDTIGLLSDLLCVCLVNEDKNNLRVKKITFRRGHIVFSPVKAIQNDNINDSNTTTILQCI